MFNDASQLFCLRSIVMLHSDVVSWYLHPGRAKVLRQVQPATKLTDPQKKHHKSQSSFNCFSLSLCTCLSAVTISKFSASSCGSCDFMSENLQRKRESAADVGVSRRFQSFSSLLICFKFLRIWKAGCGAKHGMTCWCRPAGSPCMNEHVELRFVHTKHTTVYTYTNAETPKEVCTHTIKGRYILFVSTYLACSHDFTWHDRTQYSEILNKFSLIAGGITEIHVCTASIKIYAWANLLRLMCLPASMTC